MNEDDISPKRGSEKIWTELVIKFSKETEFFYRNYLKLKTHLRQKLTHKKLIKKRLIKIAKLI